MSRNLIVLMVMLTIAAAMNISGMLGPVLQWLTVVVLLFAIFSLAYICSRHPLIRIPPPWPGSHEVDKRLSLLKKHAEKVLEKGPRHLTGYAGDVLASTSADEDLMALAKSYYKHKGNR